MTPLDEALPRIVRVPDPTAPGHFTTVLWEEFELAAEYEIPKRKRAKWWFRIRRGKRGEAPFIAYPIFSLN